MLEFLALNFGTIIVGLLVFTLLSLIVVKIIKDKRKGKCVGCDCACEGCNKSSCNPK